MLSYKVLFIDCFLRSICIASELPHLILQIAGPQFQGLELLYDLFVVVQLLSRRVELTTLVPQFIFQLLERPLQVVELEGLLSEL